MFVGPTSQAPRVDEARNDQLYELEIALREIYAAPRALRQHMPPWLVDRTLRNILVDVTGNTHRSEFCIDKLYSPDSADRPPRPAGAARLRDAAARPHERGAAAAAARAGGALLEGALPRARHALGHRAARPLPAADLHPDGLRRCHGRDAPGRLMPSTTPGSRRTSSSASRWWARSPSMGIELTLRNALEPWHVMGEEGSSGGTVRYVDSSLERIEVRVTGLNEPLRHHLQRPPAAAAVHRHHG
jgi:hypothetical protein